MGIFKHSQKIFNQPQLQLEKHSHPSSEEGFLLVVTLSFIPLLLCLCLLIVAYTNYSYLKVSSHNLCRKHLLIGQDKIRYQMLKLKKLNPGAGRLRKKHDKALRRLRNSKTPHLFAVNLALYNAVLAEQALFAARQKGHIAIATAEGLKQNALLKYKLKKLNQNTRVKMNPFPFQLKAVQTLTLTPDYAESKNFKVSQQVSASWHMLEYNKKFYNHLITSTHSPTLSGVCGATIDNEKGPKWQAVLTKKGKL